MWQGQEQKESVYLGAITHSIYSQTADSGSYSGVSNLFKTASVPDEVGRNPKTAFSSVSTAARKVLPSRQDPGYPSTTSQHVKVSPPPQLQETFGESSSIPKSMLRLLNSQPGVCRQSPTIVIPNEFRQAYSPAGGLAVKDHGKRKVQLGQHRLNYTEGDRKQDEIGGSFMARSSQPSYRSCIHLEVPLRSTSSVAFLDKSLLIPLVELDGRRAGKPTSYRSTLSVHLGVSSCRRFPTDYKPTKIHEGYREPRVAMLDHNKHNCRSSGLGQCNLEGVKVEHIAPTCGVDSRSVDSDTHWHSNTLDLLSFRRPSPLNTKAGRQKGNADEAAFLTQSDFRHKQPTSNIGPGTNFITSPVKI